MNDKKLSEMIACAYEEDELLRVRAFMEISNKAAAAAKEGKVEDLREIIRRLLWSMNDESGGVGWYAAEAAAAVLAGAPELIPEYGIILASHGKTFPFEASVHRALARIAPLKPEIFAEIAEELAGSLGHTDAAVRAAAAQALAAINPEKYRAAISALADDDSPVTLYDYETGGLKKTSVAEIVAEILKN